METFIYRQKVEEALRHIDAQLEELSPYKKSDVVAYWLAKELKAILEGEEWAGSI